MDDELDKRLNRKNGFTYPTIDPKTHMRLLQLPPANEPQPSQKISYHLVINALEYLSRTNYKALSYTWGCAWTEDDIEEIQLDAQSFFIRRNLDDFLKTAAAKDEQGLFFIDAICINQLDYNERQFQVPEMASIYRNANEVVAWLGPPDESQLDNVRALSQTKREYCASWGSNELEGFKYLSYHRYWTRIWIVQEVLLASSLRIWCGFFVFSPELFKTTSSSLADPKTKFDKKGRPVVVDRYASRLPSPAEVTVSHRLRQVLRPVKDSMAQGTYVGTWEEMKNELRNPLIIVENFQSQTPDLIHEIVRKFSKLQCSDPRDKFYGLLGLLDEGSRVKVKPDYTKDIGYAHYQALKIGLEELYFECEALAASRFGTPRGGEYPAYIGFYCDIRDAFCMEETESMLVLKQVLEELDFRTRLRNANIEAQSQQQFIWQNLEIGVLPDFERLLGYCEDKEPEGEGALFRFHKRQYGTAQRL